METEVRAARWRDLAVGMHRSKSLSLYAVLPMRRWLRLAVAAMDEAAAAACHRQWQLARAYALSFDARSLAEEGDPTPVVWRVGRDCTWH